MRIKSIRLFFLAAAVLLVFACVTINIYFPEGAVKQTADEIVTEIRKSGEEEKEKEKEKEKDILTWESKTVVDSTWLAGSFSLVPAAYAQETKVTTPKIRALREALKERFPKIKPFFDNGNIGEANDGFVKIRNEEGLSLKQKALLRKLVKEENGNRKDLYTEVARALDIDQSQIPRVGRTFAQSWIEKALPGWWIQNEDNEWINKE